MRGFVYGEIILSARSKGPRKLLELCKGSTLGDISHDDLVGKGSEFVETSGRTFRRPTLEEYCVLMKRIATPTYPKDAQTMVAMLDLAGGSRVVEAGAGSGGMTLYLSKNVGATGQVYSFESNPSHMCAAVRNYNQWRANWLLTHADTTSPDTAWPDNVQFVEADVSAVGEHISAPVDALALDLAEPGPLLSDLIPILKPSGLVAVYLPNITQHLSLLADIQAQTLPLQLERVVEVVHREWSVKPVASKHHRLANEDARKYICRPSHHQLPHTAFIGLLRRLPSARD